MSDPKLIIETITTIEEVALEFGVEDAYFVGGYPRALAMGLPLSEVHDLDIASGRPQKAMELAGFFAERAKPEDYEILHRTGTVRVTAKGLEIDFQGSSSHDEVAPYVRMWGVEETPLALNVFDRDFTMNALAIRVGTNEILDVTKRGMPDISDHRIASIIPPDVAVPRNPLMITRAIKFAARYGFSIERNLWKAMAKHVGQLEKKLSPERIAIEAYVLSKYPQAEEMLEKLGLGKLESPAMIEKGKDEVAAWSIGNQKVAQSQYPTPWELGLSNKRPAPESEDPAIPRDDERNRLQEDFEQQNEPFDYAELAEQFNIDETHVEIETRVESGGEIIGRKEIRFGQHLLRDWQVQINVLEIFTSYNGDRQSHPVRSVHFGPHIVTNIAGSWFIDLNAIYSQDANKRVALTYSIFIIFSDSTIGEINGRTVRSYLYSMANAENTRS